MNNKEKEEILYDLFYNKLDFKENLIIWLKRYIKYGSYDKKLDGKR